MNSYHTAPHDDVSPKRQLEIQNECWDWCSRLPITPAYVDGWVDDELMNMRNGQEMELAKLAREGDYVELGKILARTLLTGEWEYLRKEVRDRANIKLEDYVELFDYIEGKLAQRTDGGLES